MLKSIPAVSGRKAYTLGRSPVHHRTYTHTHTGNWYSLLTTAPQYCSVFLMKGVLKTKRRLYSVIADIIPLILSRSLIVQTGCWWHHHHATMSFSKKKYWCLFPLPVFVTVKLKAWIMLIYRIFTLPVKAESSIFAHWNGGCEASTPAVLQMSWASSYQVYVTWDYARWHPFKANSQQYSWKGIWWHVGVQSCIWDGW